VGDECFDRVWDKTSPFFLHLPLEHHVLLFDLLVLLYEIGTLIFGFYEVAKDVVELEALIFGFYEIAKNVVALSLEQTIHKPKVIIVLLGLFEHRIVPDAESLTLLLGVVESFANGLVLTRQHIEISKDTITFIVHVINFNVIY
jgi:hypothetical protein